MQLMPQVDKEFSRKFDFCVLEPCQGKQRLDLVFLKVLKRIPPISKQYIERLETRNVVVVTG
jgi:hypothetical protein